MMANNEFWPNCKYDFYCITYITSSMLPINKPRTKAILRIGPLCSLHKYSFVSIRTCATEAGSGNSIKNLSLNPD